MTIYYILIFVHIFVCKMIKYEQLSIEICESMITNEMKVADLKLRKLQDVKWKIEYSVMLIHI